MSGNSHAQKVLSALKNSSVWSEKTKETEKSISGLTCPECGHDEAYVYLERPHKIRCGRKNNCGAVTPTVSVVGDLKVDVESEYPPTKEDPHRPATMYLRGRGLDKSLEGLDYQYWKNVRETGCGAVMFPIPTPDGNTAYNGRLFDPPEGEGKTHNRGSLQNSVWRHPLLDYDSSEEVYVTEGVIDALSFIEMGFAAVAILSAGRGTDLDFDPFGKKLVFAFDNDKAGREALRKHSAFCVPPPKAIMPIEGDWNDWLLSYPSDEARAKFLDRREKFVTEAELARATSGWEYGDVLWAKRGRSGLFTYDGEYFYSKIVKNAAVVQRVSNFVAKVHHVELDKTKPKEPSHKLFLEIVPKAGLPQYAYASAKDLVG